MAMTLAALKSEFEGWYKPLLGTTFDADGAYPGQCVDLIHRAGKDLHGHPSTWGNGDALADALIRERGYARVSESSKWQMGDVVSKWTGYYGGHVYLVLEDLGSSVRYIDLNGAGSADDPAGPVTVRTATKKNIIAVARPPRYVGATAATAPPPAVTAASVLAAGGLANVPALLAAQAATGVPLHIAAAFVEQESQGKNVYGGDPGGIFSTTPRTAVTRENYLTFLSRLLRADGTWTGVTSNGVGPMQLTYWSIHRDARRAGVDLSDPTANITWGLTLVRGYLGGSSSQAAVQLAATRYNAGPEQTTVNWYGLEVWEKAEAWRVKLAGTTTTDPGGETVIVPEQPGVDPGPMPPSPPTVDGSPAPLPPQADPGARPVLADFQAREVTPLPAITPGPVVQTPSLVSKPGVRVYMRGAWWFPTSWKVGWDQGVPGPDQSPWGTGMTAATGEITLVAVPTPLVMRDGLNPFRDEVPQEGEPVLVEITKDGTLTWTRIFTGVVDDTAGVVGEREIRVGITDGVGSLDKTISVPPRNFRHPSPIDGHRYMSIGSHGSSVTAEIAPVGGFRATPAPHPTATIVSAPMLGTAWAEVGTLEDATTMVAKSPTSTTPSDSPEYVRTSWGLTVANLWARYRPRLGAGTSGRMDQSKAIRAFVAPVKDMPAFVELWWRSSSIMLTVDWRGITVETQDGWLDNGFRNVLYGRTRALTEDEKAKGFELVAWIGSDRSLSISVDGVVTNHTLFPSYTREMNGTNLWQVRITTWPDGTLLGGVQVYSTEDRSVIKPFTRNLILDVNPKEALFGVPAIEDRTALEVLREKAEKCLSTIWVDEYGRLWEVARTRMDARPSRRTLTRRDVLPGTGWLISKASVFSAVEGTWQQPSASQNRMSSGYGTTVWESSSDSIRPQDTWEDKAAPPAGIDWISVDRSPLKLSLATVPQVNAGIGTTLAGTTRQTDGDGKVQEGVPSVTWYNATIERESSVSYPIEVRYRPPEPVVALLQLAAPDLPDLSAAAKGKGLVLRARARQVWRDFSTARPKPTGNTTLDRTYKHDGGWWIQSPAVMDDTLVRLAQQFAQPLPALDGLELADIDPTIRRADTITLDRDGFLTPQRVVGLQWEGGPGGVRQILAVRQIRP